MPSSPARPTWNHGVTKGFPVTASDCAVSHSWCGKDEIASPAVDVDRFPQLAEGGSRALDVPTRAAPTERDPHAGSSGGGHSTKSSGTRGRCPGSKVTSSSGRQPTNARAPDRQSVEPFSADQKENEVMTNKRSHLYQGRRRPVDHFVHENRDARISRQLELSSDAAFSKNYSLHRIRQTAVPVGGIPPRSAPHGTNSSCKSVFDSTGTLGRMAGNPQCAATPPQSSLRVLRIYHSAILEVWRARDRELINLGVDETLVTARQWNEGGANVSFEAGTDKFAHAIRTYGTRPNLFLYDPWQLWKFFGRHRFDLFDFHEEPFSLAMGELLIMRMLRARRVPFVVYTAQNIEKRYPPPFRWFERWCLREAAGAYPCNEAAGEILRKKGLRSFFVNLPLGLDPAAFVPAQRGAPIPGRLHIGYVGRLAAHKGVDVLLRAIALAGNVTAEIVGDGPAAGQLEQLAHSIGLDNRVVFVGYLPPSDLPELYRRLDAVVVPSIPVPGWDEQFCRVAVEAMASGVPVIASSTGALPEVIGSGGLFVPPGDALALAQALQTLSSQNQMWASLRSAGLRSVDKFYWGTIAKSQEKLYQRSVASPEANATV